MNNQTHKKYFSCSTILNQMLQAQKRFDCFKLGSRQNNCDYLKYKLNNCSLYLYLSFNESLEDGSFWFKNKNDKISNDCTMTKYLNSYPNLTRNYPISNLINNGFQIVYDQFYSLGTMYSDMSLAKSYCNLSSILCTGGSLTNSDILELVACGNCNQIFRNTTLNSPNLVGSVYWYMTPGQSFGFSPSFTITQNTADTCSQSDPLRLSWHFDQNYGGWRLGNMIDLDFSTLYKKLLFVKV
ncbi:unnamed protein product [Brachionus calyciflorus]|uniref:Uncharacterized protein n=1 Tax=Brachionus calyciflorus TaxID=104777 RepID=A0A814IY92_9BILA|nr:unnamed protein product [Brachionus calyciflorus]